MRDGMACHLVIYMYVAKILNVHGPAIVIVKDFYQTGHSKIE